jgi:type IV pilus assembly protein PilN
MIRINLLPVRAAQKKEALRGQLTILGLSLAGTVLVCGGVYATMLMQISAEQEAKAAKQAELQQLKKAIGEVDHFKKLQGELQEKLAILNKLKQGKTGPVRLLDALSTALPEKLWLTTFKENGGAVSIAGLGMSEETVATFMRNLEESPAFKNVELQVTEQTSQGDGPRLQKFELSCAVESPPAPPTGQQ